MAEQRLIDASKLLDKFQFRLPNTDETSLIVNDCVAIARKAIMEEPTVDAVPVVHGRWETDKEDIRWGNSLKRKHCSNCGKRPHFDKEQRVFILADFCHHCGAKMDGDGNV